MLDVVPSDATQTAITDPSEAPAILKAVTVALPVSPLSWVLQVGLGTAAACASGPKIKASVHAKTHHGQGVAGLHVASRFESWRPMVFLLGVQPHIGSVQRRFL
jgi:hypothetical protein